jgi:hypothetical protein
MSISRIYLTILLLSVLTASAFAASRTVALSDNVADELNNAAATGNPLVLHDVTARMSATFPTMKEGIIDYVDRIALPAVAVMAAVNEMDADEAPVNESGEDFSAAELNDLAVGAGAADGEFVLEN